MSALEKTGIDEFWSTVERHHSALVEAGEFDARRSRQQIDWTWTMVRDEVLNRLAASPDVAAVRTDVERRIASGDVTPALAAQEILTAFDRA